MDFLLSRDDFSIKFYDIVFYIKDINMDAPISGTIRIEIKSDKYAAKSYLDVSHKDFINFLQSLVSLWKSLKPGKAIIKEPYGYEQYVEFTSENGKFLIKGNLIDPEFRNYKIDFEEIVDQSYLTDFIKAIEKFDIAAYSK